jgi:hypothetical protein
MAGLRGAVTFSGIAGVQSAYKTLIQVAAPSAQRIRITAIRLACEGTVTTDPPVMVQYVRQTSAGSSTGTGTPTPVKLDVDLSETIQTTAITGPASGAWTTSEPTATDVIYQDAIHPQGRIPEVWIVPEIWVPAGGRLGLRVNVGSGAVNSFGGTIYFEE